MNFKAVFHKNIRNFLILLVSLSITAGLCSACSLESLSASASDTEIGALALPDNSDTCSYTLALQLLGISSGYTEDSAKAVAESANLEVLKQENYDKEDDDPSHTSAYTIAKGNVYYNNSLQKAVLITVRGTSAGEWYSNFDFSASRSNDAYFAENFLFAAEDIFLNSKDLIDNEFMDEDPLIIVCGHSRGAACANLLGVLFDEEYGSSNVFDYTFATPNTVHNDSLSGSYNNIFNFINPCDVVPCLPLEEWGYSRAGVDIILPVSDKKIKNVVDDISETFYSVADSVESYYLVRHSLDDAGLDEHGLTPFDVMTMFCKSLVNIEDTITDSLFDDDDMDKISKKSDFYPLVELSDTLSANDNELAMEVLSNHLPTAYEELITQYAKQNSN